ncbi:glycosyltransferase [Microbacterium halophytorum]|uniref:glycosyltransferase n=1 Tax=Microbacterium halophytorum TaxID=2067568 RepID=UPI0015716E8D|nr:glycosyltransferase [Microbacterium halophytorum]
MQTGATVIVPTRNERGNVAELVARVADALSGREAEILFVDDSDDGTPDEVARIAADASLPVRVLHRTAAERTGGLGGAVVAGLRAAAHDVCIVMDGDLQHPPSTLPVLLDRYDSGDVDAVIASRYTGGGHSAGLASRARVWVSRASTAVTKAMFPVRMRDVTDPMTGFFLVDRRRVALDALRPDGFKILLEVLVRSELRVAEVPLAFAPRGAGASKADARQGLHFLGQLARLRFGKMSVFAAVGAFGAVLNVAIVWALTAIGVEYIVAAVIAAEVTIIGNFLLQERFVFHDMRAAAAGFWRRFATSFAFNNVEAAIRIPVMALMVETWGISSPVATAITLAVAFLARFVFHSLVVYRPRRIEPDHRHAAAHRVEEAARSGELVADTGALRIIRGLDRDEA